MSLTGSPVIALENAVSMRFASVCQKGNPARPRANRLPYTTSASPLVTRETRRGSSCGSYSRSESCTTTTSPRASANPRWRAAPFPRFEGWWKIRTCVRPDGSAEVTSVGAALPGEKGPGATREADAPEHRSRLSHFEGPLRLRRHLGDALDRRRSAPRHLLELPSLLHRQAEADRHAGAHRPVPEEVRQRAEGSAKEGEARGSREEGRSKGREEARKEAEDGEEAQGRRLAPPAFAARSECQKNRQRGL